MSVKQGLLSASHGRGELKFSVRLQNTVLVCRHAEKTLQLVRLLRRESVQNEAAKYIVYFSTVAAVDYFYRVRARFDSGCGGSWLNDQILSRLPELSQYAFTSLHGDLPPRVRETALSSFTTHPSSHLSPAVLLCTDVAARGVDFADIDMVIQYDPPTDPKTFSHRAGRTARAGRSGRAVLLLGKGREKDYIDFLNVRKIPLVRQDYIGPDLEPTEAVSALDPAAVELLETIRSILLTDRDLHDKAAKAFVSALRAYQKHEATFIFRASDLDLHSVAVAFGLLRLPAMPEIKEWRRKLEKAHKQRDPAENNGEAESEAAIVPWSDATVDVSFQTSSNVITSPPFSLQSYTGLTDVLL